jgi:hypothetical protein
VAVIASLVLHTTPADPGASTQSVQAPRCRTATTHPKPTPDCTPASQFCQDGWVLGAACKAPARCHSRSGASGYASLMLCHAPSYCWLPWEVAVQAVLCCVVTDPWSGTYGGHIGSLCMCSACVMPHVHQEWAPPSGAVCGPLLAMPHYVWVGGTLPPVAQPESTATPQHPSRCWCSALRAPCEAPPRHEQDICCGCKCRVWHVCQWPGVGLLVHQPHSSFTVSDVWGRHAVLGGPGAPLWIKVHCVQQPTRQIGHSGQEGRLCAPALYGMQDRQHVLCWRHPSTI